MSAGKWFRMLLTSRNDLARARRYLPALMRDEAEFQGVAIPGAKAELQVLVGLDEIRYFFTLTARRPEDWAQFVTSYAAELLSEATARHTDENPVILLVALLPASAPGEAPQRGPIQYVPVEGMPA